MKPGIELLARRPDHVYPLSLEDRVHPSQDREQAIVPGGAVAR